MAVSTLKKASGRKQGSTGRGISFSALAGIASLVGGVVLLPVVISAVGPTAYGTWLFLLAVASFLFFLDLGVGIAVIHFLARSRSGDEESEPSQIASTAHAWALGAALVAILIFLLVGWSYRAEALEHASQMELSTMFWCGVALLASMALRPMSSVLIGAGYLHIERRNQIVGVGIRIAGTLAACWIFDSLVGVVIAETLALIAPTLMSARAVRNMGLVRLSRSSISRMELKRMFAYSMGSFTVSMVGASVLQFGTLIIGVLGNPGQVTYFNAAFRIYLSVRQIIGWLTDPFRPVLSRLYVKNPAQARAVLYDLLFVSFITSILGCIVLLVTLPTMLKLWLGDSVPLDDVAITAGALLSGLMLNAIHIPLIPASDAAGRPGAFLLHQIFWLLSYAGLSLLLFPLLGITGVALAMTIPLPILEFAYLLKSRETVHLNFEKWFRKVIQPSLPVLFLGVIAAACTNLVGTNVFGLIAVGLGYVLLSLIVLFLTRTHWSHQSILGSLRLES